MTHRRIGLLLTLALGLVVVPPAAQAATFVRIGWLLPFLSPSPDRPSGVSRVLFPQVMGELGWVEGQNLIIERRYAELQYDRLPALAAELVQLQQEGLVESLARPGGNVTGVSSRYAEVVSIRRGHLETAGVPPGRGTPALPARRPLQSELSW